MVQMRGLLTLQGQLFSLMALGLFFRRRGIVGAEFQAGLVDVVIGLILPCNIIASFQVEFTPAVLRESAVIFAVSVGVQLLCWLLAVTMFRRVAPEKRAALQYGTLCSNAGFLGTPVAEGIFGSQGTLLASVYLTPQRIAMWTLGVAFFDRGTQKTWWKRAFTHPCIVAVFIGMALMAAQIPLSGVVGNTVSALGRCNTAMSMLLIGMMMSDFRWQNFLNWEAWYYSAIRLGLIPLLVLLSCRALGLDALATGISVVLAAMPAGATTAILAAKYGTDTESAAGCLTVSTLLSLVAIPLWGLAL